MTRFLKVFPVLKEHLLGKGFKGSVNSGSEKGFKVTQDLPVPLNATAFDRALFSLEPVGDMLTDRRTDHFATGDGKWVPA